MKLLEAQPTLVRSWNFEQFVTTFQKCFLTLEEYGEPVAERKKVRDLINAIDKSTSIGMTTAIAAILASDVLSNNFTQASNYLTQFVLANKSLMNHRQVAGATSGTKGG